MEQPKQTATDLFMALYAQGIKPNNFWLAEDQPWEHELRKAISEIYKDHPKLSPPPFPDYNHIHAIFNEDDTFSHFKTAPWALPKCRFSLIMENKLFPTNYQAQTLEELKKAIETDLKKYPLYIHYWNITISYNEATGSFSWKEMPEEFKQAA